MQHIQQMCVITEDERLKSVIFCLSAEICSLTSKAGHAEKTHQHCSQILTYWNQLTGADVT